MNQPLTWLALGDSYTIGEGCALHESYPIKTLQLLRKEGFLFNAPEIIAKTGWTSAELSTHLDETRLNSHYDIVTLLIGVNNQYRGIPEEQYSLEFAGLVNLAITKTGNRPDRVMVLSIPDWGQTPFGANRDRIAISSAIARYNDLAQLVCLRYGVGYIHCVTDASQVVADGLHPSAKVYAAWANLLKNSIIRALACE